MTALALCLAKSVSVLSELKKTIKLNLSDSLATRMREDPIVKLKREKEIIATVWQEFTMQTIEGISRNTDAQSHLHSNEEQLGKNRTVYSLW